MSPPTQLHADARDVDDPHFVGIALTGHKDSTCRAMIEVKGQGHYRTVQTVRNCTVHAHGCMQVLAAAARQSRLSHHMTATQIHWGPGGTGARFPNLSITLHCYRIETSLRVNQWALKTNLPGSRRCQASSACSGN